MGIKNIYIRNDKAQPNHINYSMWDLNPRPPAHKTGALPTELNEFVENLISLLINIAINMISVCVIGPNHRLLL